MKAFVMLATGIMIITQLHAEPAASKSNGSVSLAKRDIVELEFETSLGLWYQVLTKQEKTAWEPYGQPITGNGKTLTKIYTGDEAGVEFRVDTIDFDKPKKMNLPEGIDISLLEYTAYVAAIRFVWLRLIAVINCLALLILLWE